MSFMLFLTLITYIGLFHLRIYHWVFLYEDPIKIITGCGSAVAVTVVLLIITAIIERAVVSRFEKALKNRNTEEVLRCYKNFSIPLVCVFLIGFFIGVGVTNIIDGLKGTVEWNVYIFIFMLFQGMSVGYFGYTVTNYRVKKFLMAERMKKAGIKNADYNINTDLHRAVVSLILLSSTDFIIVPLGILQNPGVNPLAKFFIYSLISAVFNGVICTAGYKIIFKNIQKNDRFVKDHLYEEMQNLAIAAKESAATGQDQNAAIKEIVATVEDSNNLSASIQQKVSDVTILADKSKNDVESGIDFLEGTINDLVEVLKSTMSTIDGIKDLGLKVDNIWDIVKLINDLADQAKIIAFNAELEASAAGEAGKNFHIVATEVRRLSDNIIDSTHEVKDKIQEVQKSSDSLILASEKGGRLIDNGHKNIRSLESKFASIKESSELTAKSSEDIKMFMQQLSTSSEQILVAMKQIASGVDNFSQSTENISKSSEHIKELAGQI